MPPRKILIFTCSEMESDGYFDQIQQMNNLLALYLTWRIGSITDWEINLMLSFIVISMISPPCRKYTYIAKHYTYMLQYSHSFMRLSTIL